MESLIGEGTSSESADLIKDVTVETFRTDVLEASMEVPVIVDFWATWCGPCKQLTPVLEKAVVEARGAVRLAKVDIDANQTIAAQLGIQSVPTVFGFYRGQPVDAFQGALPESEVRAFIKKLGEAAGTGVQDPVADAIDQARQRLADEDYGVAAEIFRQVVQHAPDNADARAGLARALAAQGETDQAEEILSGIPEDQAGHPDAAAARAAVDLARQSESVGDLAALEAAAAAAPREPQVLFDLAIGLFAAGRRSEAIDHLIEVLRIDRNWQDGAAREQLIQFFDVMGPTDEETVAGRRKMSSVLFS